MRSAIIKSFDVKNLLANTEDLIFEISYQLNDKGKNIADKFELKIPNVWEEYHLENEPVNNRTTDFQIYYPFSIKSRSALVDSPDFLFRNMKGMNKQSAFGSAETKFKEENSENVFEFFCEVNTGKFDKKDYSDYVAFFIDAIDQSRPEIVFSND